MNRSVLVVGALVLLASSAGIAQQKRVVTAADYDRAVKMLAPSLNGLVVGDTVTPTWLPDGRLWYVRTTLTGTDVVGRAGAISRSRPALSAVRDISSST